MRTLLERLDEAGRIGADGSPGDKLCAEAAATIRFLQEKNLSERYFLDYDAGGHWLIIPLVRIKEWEDWVRQLRFKNPDWNVPDFAKDIDGLRSLSFADPGAIYG